MSSEINKVAIIMATYNGEEFIEELIDSLLSQTHKNWVLDLPRQFGTLLISEKGERNGLQKIPGRIYGSSSAIMLSRRCKS